MSAAHDLQPLRDLARPAFGDRMYAAVCRLATGAADELGTRRRLSIQLDRRAAREAARPLPGAGVVLPASRGPRADRVPTPETCQPAVSMGELALLVATPRPVSIAPWAMDPPRAGSTDRRRQERAARWLARRVASIQEVAVGD